VPTSTFRNSGPLTHVSGKVEDQCKSLQLPYSAATIADALATTTAATTFEQRVKKAMLFIDRMAISAELQVEDEQSRQVASHTGIGV
jgi:hypothetical protein